jgi:outer membrane protein OmpA-like peptidoglycan-associated protein
MKNEILAITLLCAAMAVPGFAQQTNSSAQPGSQTPPASQTASKDPLQAPTSTDFWDGDDPNFVNLITHPFASKKYVQRLTVPIRDRVNELDGITADNSKAIKDVDSRAQQGIQLASEKSSVADQHATEAGTKAQTAQLAATDANTRVSSAEQMVSNLDQYKAGAQTEIRFRAGQTVLSKQAKDALDEMAAPLKDQRSYIIEVRGFAAGNGSSAIAASQKMADSVARYLVLSHQIPMFRIYVVAMGNAPVAEGTAARHTSGGRVEVNLLKNDLTAAQR